MREMRVVVVAVICLSGREAFAQCRTIVELGSDSPVFEPQQWVGYTLRREVPVGVICPVDAGAPDAAPPAPDASADASTADASPCDTRYGDTVTMTVQPRFSTGSGGARFALLMVTPGNPLVQLEGTGFFTTLDEMTKPAVVYEDTIIETPTLGNQCEDPKYPAYEYCQGGGSGGGGGWDDSGSGMGCGGGGGGGGGGDGYGEPPPPNLDDLLPTIDAGLPDDTQIVGSYEVAVLGTHDTAALAAWFDAHNYGYTKVDLDAVAPYIERGWVVVAVRMAVTSLDEAALEPLSFTWEGDAMTLPVALSSGPGAIPLPARLYVRAEGRYDFPGAFVSYAQPMGSGAFLTRNELWTNPSGNVADDPVAFRQADDPYLAEEVIRREIHIPMPGCGPCTPSPQPADPPSSGGGSDRSICGCHLGRRNRGLPGLLLLAGVGVAALRLGGRRGARRRSG